MNLLSTTLLCQTGVLFIASPMMLLVRLPHASACRRRRAGCSP
jgi:hypothetical protein